MAWITQNHVSNVKAYTLLPGDSIAINGYSYEITDKREKKGSDTLIFILSGGGGELLCHRRSIQQKLQYHE